MRTPLGLPSAAFATSGSSISNATSSCARDVALKRMVSATSRNVLTISVSGHLSRCCKRETDLASRSGTEGV